MAAARGKAKSAPLESHQFLLDQGRHRLMHQANGRAADLRKGVWSLVYWWR